MPRRARTRQQRRARELAPLGIADLFAGMSPGDFLTRHWKPRVPVVRPCAKGVLQRIAGFPALRSCGALLKKRKQEVYLFGPDGSRGLVSPAAALPFLRRGYNLYIPGVEADVPDAVWLFGRVASDLGVLPWQISLEAFAGVKGGLSSRHYDNDFNIQILIEGEKRWRMEENDVLRNPARSCHPEPGNSQFAEEAYAVGELPLEFNPARTREFSARAGSATLVPRGMWHEARCVSSSWSVSVQIKGMTRAQALTDALRDRLHRDADFRAYLGGVAFEGSDDRNGAERERELAELKAAARRALEQISSDEAALSGTRTVFRWSERAGRRALQTVEGALCLVAPGLLEQAIELDAAFLPALRALLRFRRPFQWRDALAMAGNADPKLLHNLIELLIDLGALERGRFSERWLDFVPEQPAKGSS